MIYTFKLRSKLFSYERSFAWNEVKQIASFYNALVERISRERFILKANAILDIELLKKVTYFKEIDLSNGDKVIPDIARWEESTFVNGKYSTRYASHGIHEYKGKFNPQVVHSLLNQYLNFDYKDKVIYDPFAGSGTSLLEASLMEMGAVGNDVNPLAVLISEAKQDSLNVNMDQLVTYWKNIVSDVKKQRDFELDINSERLVYLAKWFPIDTLTKLELVRQYIFKLPAEYKKIIEVIVSNVLRDYSYQDPGDLRIRRRKEIPKQTEILEKIGEDIQDFSNRMLRFNSIYSYVPVRNHEYQISSEKYKVKHAEFDLGITSPPYATALPYIDTQRLSIVWCDLAKPTDIKKLDQNLIGTRESSKKHLDLLRDHLRVNKAALPLPVIKFLQQLQAAINFDTDGFRKQATPALLYQYFEEMQKMFKNVKSNLKKNAFYLLIVGTNKTTLGGTKFIIDTPDLLGQIAESLGWKLIDIVELQTYKRYGINAKNSVNVEKLIVLQN